MAKIADVAQRAGVSAATVSRVFNGQRVNEDMESRVRIAMTELNYTPSRTARSLRRQTSEIIALIIPDIENPYFTELARGVEDVARGANYSVVLCNSDSNTEKETQYLNIAISENMAGVIVAPSSSRTVLDGLADAHIPVVAIDRPTSYPIDSVLVANKRAAQGATECLIDAGYRRIACITGPRGVKTASERLDGWRDALDAHGLAAPASYLVRSTFRVDGGRTAMANLLDDPNPPDAVVAANNLMGVGVLQVLTERRLFPPEVGVAVVGSLPFTTLSPTGITFAHLPARKMGLVAAHMLMSRIAGDKQPPRTRLLPYRLEPAKSTPPE